MNHRACIRTWFDIVLSTLAMGLSALVGMLSLDYLVTGRFGALREYLAITLLVTLVTLFVQWRRHHLASQGHPSEQNALENASRHLQ